MKLGVVAFVCPVSPGAVSRLEAALAEIDLDPGGNRVVPFANVPGLHFASLILTSAADLGARLIFECNFDGALARFIEDLGGAALAGLHELLSACRDYEADAARLETVTAYLSTHAVKPGAYHIGNTGRTVDRIVRESELYDFLEVRADGTACSAATEPETLFAEFVTAVRAEGRFAWAHSSEARQSPAERVLPRVALAAAAVLALLLFPLVIGWMLALRVEELTDPAETHAPPPELLAALNARENRFPGLHNHMTSLAPLKPGFFRLTTLRGVLFLVNLLARALATNGSLSGIPSIHFAHWSIIDRGRTLLFLSNFDGSWENYLDDFIDRASPGLTAIWSNTVGFPRTSFLVFGGARNARAFKAIARARQVPASAWYQRYPDLTVQAIDARSSLREGLLKPPQANAAVQWLRKL